MIIVKDLIKELLDCPMDLEVTTLEYTDETMRRRRLKEVRIIQNSKGESKLIEIEIGR